MGHMKRYQVNRVGHVVYALKTLLGEKSRVSLCPLKCTDELAAHQKSRRLPTVDTLSQTLLAETVEEKQAMCLLRRPTALFGGCALSMLGMIRRSGFTENSGSS
jgi:hypothetical protein